MHNHHRQRVRRATRAKLDGRRIGRVPLDVDRGAIVSDRKTGLSLTLVANKHGVSRATVCRLVNESNMGATSSELQCAAA
jgi:DNA invertase Pin-like site-specific DNA recombinase